MAVFKEAVETRTGISRGRIALIVCAILLCAAFFTCAGTNDDAYAGDYLIKVNRQQNVATVYAKGSGGDYTVPVRTMLCITGENNSTPLGTYHISNQYRWKIMIGGVWSQYASRFNGDILLHSITYYDGRKQAGYVSKLLAVEPVNDAGRTYLVPGANLVIEGGERLSPKMVVQIQESPYTLKPMPGQYDSGQQMTTD